MSEPPDPSEPAGLLDVLFLRLYAAGLAALSRALDLVALVRSPRLLGPYLRLWGAAFAESPFSPHTFEKVSEARRRGVALRELVYGETPLFTARRLFGRAGVGPGKVLIDLGAGRGRALLAARALGAEARGVELLESHVRRAAPALASAGVALRRGDGADAELHDVTHAFLPWTCMSERTRERFRERLRALPAGAVVITLSTPLDDEAFRLTDRSVGLFTWGLEPVYGQVRRGE